MSTLPHITTRSDSSPHSALRTPRPELGPKAPHSMNGFTYIALLAAIVIIGISLGAAGKYWQNVMMREKEEELLFRGEQYRLAIDRYFVATCGKTFQPCAQSALPQSIENLLSDDRFPNAKRHLRQKYQDPITGKDFELFRDMAKGNRITGVYSSSDKEPIKKMDFPEQYKDFVNKNSYKDWKFIYSIPTISVKTTDEREGSGAPIRRRILQTTPPTR